MKYLTLVLSVKDGEEGRPLIASLTNTREEANANLPCYQLLYEEAAISIAPTEATSIEGLMDKLYAEWKAKQVA